jgi:asparagine synthase (glutamine-hydrolysing)
MCGIAGFVGTWDENTLVGMKKMLRHRGPDDNGHFHDPDAGIGLAHTRLSIIGVETGHQPLTNADGSVVVNFNGEIYNYRDLRRDLEAKGYEFRTESDGEVIPHLYNELGNGFISKLRGMFSIALWDNKRRKLLLVRDRFGIKPLYFMENSRGLIFASEIKAILSTEVVEDLDPQAMRWYLSFRYVPEDLTMFAGIRKLLPGHFLEFTPEHVSVQRYWQLEATHDLSSRSDEAIADELKSRLAEAVDMRLMSEVPLGSFLSGGLDSSSIVGLMSQISKTPVQSFSFGVGSGWHNESHFAELVAKHFGTEHRALSGDCGDPETLKDSIWHLDEPLGDMAIIPTYLLSKLTREHVTIALTGEGADELLGGYDKYKALIAARRLRGLSWAAKAGESVAGLSRGPGFRRALRCVARSGDFADAYMSLVSVFDESEVKSLLTPELAARLKNTEPATAVIERILKDRTEMPLLDQLMHIDIETWLPNDVLLKADKMSMAHSLEARVPFLDHEFAEFCASIPPRLKIRWLKEKYILRQAMKGLVPDEIRRRRKHGFTVSLKPWLNDDGATGLIPETLSASRLQDRGWFDGGVVQQLTGGNLDNPFTRRQVFSLLMAEQWATTFLDNHQLAATT